MVGKNNYMSCWKVGTEIIENYVESKNWLVHTSVRTDGQMEWMDRPIDKQTDGRLEECPG